MNPEVITPEPRSRRLLHAWAVLTVLLALPLVLLGAAVTTKQVGMVDPAWPTAPWHLFGIGWMDRGVGYLIEHGHRLAGYCVGLAAIVLATGLWFCEPRRWVRWLGVAALAGVCFQGLLGGLRVLWHQKYGPDVGTTFALIHGCFGQMVFALLVCVAVCTSRSWRQEADTVGRPLTETTSLRRLSLALTALVLCQLALGAFVRHWRDEATAVWSGPYLLGTANSHPAARGHLIVAFAVVAAAVWLVRLIHDRHSENRQLLAASWWLAGLVAFQILLGVQTWFARYPQAIPPTFGLPSSDHWFYPELFRSGHVLVGAFILATSSALTLEAWRRTSWNLAPVAAPGSRLEGAA